MHELFSETLRLWLFNPLTNRLLVLSLGLLAIVVVVKLLHRNIARFVDHNTTRYQLRKLVNFVAYFITAFMVTVVLSDRLNGFTIAFGAAGAGIAFALQEVVVSIAGWVALTFSVYYRVGDRVRLGGITGDVIDIGMLRTTIMQVNDWVQADQYNGGIVRVSNSFVLKEPVYNYSIDFPFLWDEIMLPIKYGSDRQLIRKIMLDVAAEVTGEYTVKAQAAWVPMTQKYLVESANVRPMVTMTANQNWMEYSLRYVIDYRLRRSTKDKLFTRILDEIDSNSEHIAIGPR
ncbi:MAG TPA: mechanosensitive ion channel family protein [Methylophilaceae bacterium]|nr:mechanosensitive ion channel family protein [Methylophilaceae bacterium]